MKLLVCGGRDYSNRKFVFYTLDRIHDHRPIDIIIHGAADGADTLAEDWAKSRQIAYIGVPAEWKKYSKRAGMIRNSRMLREFKPDGVCAFPGGVGTKGMIEIADKAGVQVMRVGQK